jgi:transposase
MEDILDVYKRPYDEKRPLVCMDELNKQMIKEIRCPLLAREGDILKYDTEYERNGTCNLFLSFEPLKGKRKAKVTERRTKIDWAHFMKDLIDEEYSQAEKVVLVLDNLNTHTGSALYEAFEPAEARRLLDKLEIHYTPKHGSWLNMVEIELSHLSRQCLDRRIPDRETFHQEVSAWVQQRNHEGASVDWRFTTQDARIKLKKLYPIVN